MQIDINDNTILILSLSGALIFIGVLILRLIRILTLILLWSTGRISHSNYIIIQASNIIMTKSTTSYVNCSAYMSMIILCYIVVDHPSNDTNLMWGFITNTDHTLDIFSCHRR